MPQPLPAPNNGLSTPPPRGRDRGPKAARPPRPPASRRPRRGPTRERLTFPEPARPRAPPSLCLWQTWLAEKRAPSPPPPLPSGLPSCPAPGPLPAIARLLALRSPRSLPPRRWLRALSSCQSVSPGRGPIALELLPRRLGLSCAAARPKPAACSLARGPRARRPAPPAPPSAPSAPLPLPPPPLVYLELNRTWLPRQESGGRPRPATDGRGGQSARGGGPGGREGRLSALPRQSRCASSVSRCPLVCRPGERRASPGAGVGRRREGLGPGPEHPASATGTGRCGTSHGGRRGPRLARRAPFRVGLVPCAPALPVLILPSVGQDPGRPSSPPHPGLPASSPAPRARARSARGAGRPKLAGAKARGCFFTRSLKYFGKPQSGAARKMALGVLRANLEREKGS